MGIYLSTDIASPQIVSEGGLLSGNFTASLPHAGHFYGLVEQFTSAFVLIPGSRAYMYRAVVGEPFVNSAVDRTVFSALVADEEVTGSLLLTLLNTDCHLYVSLKEIAHVIPAGSLVVGNTYKILSIGTTDFTLIGASSNTVGVDFIATGAGAGTGIVCGDPDPDSDSTIDYFAIVLQAPGGIVDGINMSSIMNLMITMMIVVMMMKMMAGAMTGVIK